jgi:hypothetical protein
MPLSVMFAVDVRPRETLIDLSIRLKPGRKTVNW